MTFAHPVMLLAFMALPCFWWLAARGRSVAAPRWIVWRACTAGLLLLAASGAAIATGGAPIVAVAALDRSASVSSRSQRLALERVNAFVPTMSTGDRLGLVSFGADTALDLRPVGGARRLTVQTAVADSGTDIGAVLRLARATFPRDGPRRIVLMSDGRDTVGAAEREAVATAAARIAIDVVIPEAAVAPMRLTRVIAPDDAAVREPYLVSAEVAGTPGTRGSLTFYRDDEPIGTRDVVIGVDGTASVELSEQQHQAAIHVYRAALQADGTDGAPSTAAAVVVVSGEPVILYVYGGSGSLGSVLTRAGYTVNYASPEQVPQQAAAFGAFAGVVLDDVPAERLASGAAEALAAYVEDAGGGLLILGSSRTLTPSGFPTTALERIIPVDVRPRAGQRAPSVDLVLVFDKSGSMADVSDGLPKIEIARQAVLGAADVMPPNDSIGVLAFDSKPTVVAPLAATRETAALRIRLRDIAPAGSTAIAPAIDLGLQWLHAAGRPPSARRLMLLISDGRTSDTDAARLRTLVRTGGVELSVVAVGPNANRALLEDLAASSGGRAYFPDTLRDLPRTVAREAARFAAGSVVQERFAPHLNAHPVVAGIDATKLPVMNGYVVGAAKPTAQTILASHLDDPILCAWRAGLGRVAVFTADLASSWSAPLRSWHEGDRLWLQTMRWLDCRVADDAVDLRLHDTDRGPRLEVSLAPGADVADTVTALVRTNGAPETEVELEPSAPGRYEATLPATATGLYVVALTAHHGRNGTESRIVRALYWSADREHLAWGADVQLLSRLAALTGGRVLRDGESPFAAPRPIGYRDLSMWTVGAALAMFLLDIAGFGTIGLARFRQWQHRAGRGSRAAL